MDELISSENFDDDPKYSAEKVPFLGVPITCKEIIFVKVSVLFIYFVIFCVFKRVGSSLISLLTITFIEKQNHILQVRSYHFSQKIIRLSYNLRNQRQL